MGINILVEMVASLLALVVGGVATSREIKDTILKLLGKKTTEKSYSERLNELTTNLTKSTAEVDKILAELSSVSKSREDAINKLNTDLADLEKKEQESKKRLEDLQNLPIPVAEHFKKLMGEGEKKSAKRDYLLFGAGVLVSTVIAILLKVFGLG